MNISFLRLSFHVQFCILFCWFFLWTIVASMIVGVGWLIHCNSNNHNSNNRHNNSNNNSIYQTLSACSRSSLPPPVRPFVTGKRPTSRQYTFRPYSHTLTHLLIPSLTHSLTHLLTESKQQNSIIKATRPTMIS